MLLAILYAENGELLATAPACDQQPFGHRYWREVHPENVDLRRATETAYVEIEDEGLVERLLCMGFVDGSEAAEFVDQYFALSPVADTPLVISATVE